MFNVPVTYMHEYENVSDALRPVLLREMAAHGVKHLVLSHIFLSRILMEPGFKQVIRKEVADAGLDFVDSHAPFGPVLDMNCADPALRREMILRNKLMINIVAEMGVKTITIHLGNEHRWPGVSMEKQIDFIRDSLEQLLPEAEKCGVTLCIENIWFRLSTPERLLAYKKEFPTDTLGFCYDSGHANLMQNGKVSRESVVWDAWAFSGFEEPEWEEDVLQQMLPHVVTCHLHDNDAVRDRHNMPGCGTVNWQKVVAQLHEAPRLQCIQSEVLPVRVSKSIHEICDAFAGIGVCGI